ncbi:hypothetical protein AB0G95_21745 [Streptomyces virginiae]|uniref:hypothetical protein n=1 Tax=Streptomyces virginiae TaxID=1961 RepID=UPI003429A020
MNNTTAAVASLGCVTIGLGIALWKLIMWWRGGKKFKSLLPLVGSWGYGALAVLCAGGILGVLTSWGVGIGSWAGDLALASATGSATPTATRSHLVALSPGGSAILLLMTVAMVAILVSAKGAVRTDMSLMITSGVLTGLAGGIAGVVAATLVPVANNLGAQLTGVM